MKRVRLGSSAIAAVAYDQKERTLDVECRERETYRYLHEPEFVYHQLLRAGSAGTFWNQVKDNYEFMRLEN